ncbi:hemerythrin domain-containing protein [Chitinimonas taiwanensis]|uniref:Hemerythrin HHE cation binding domain-containing protein n=1 Tax=Chitinimonas taiwanensis DSM 18899 TaxID=1121279 RepID=A0A1K2H9E5_9NEIS|nr:hemerythrin domain-containing protein [Chitinimonas taiwanensis]SFZ73422.1 Hemerythrin HHE cation binding domain-containing protein [Chitinimonas taiwanensis DSM 18899]
MLNSPAIAPGFDEPIALLTACHDKVRRFASLSLKLDEHLSRRGQDEEAAQAAANILRYFDMAAPLHHADEEDDLFPALRELDDPALNADLARIEAEHASLDVLWQAVRPWLQAIADHGVPLRPAELAAFARDYPAHAAREEALLYPAARQLSPTTLARIGQNMRARRGATA